MRELINRYPDRTLFFLVMLWIMLGTLFCRFSGELFAVKEATSTLKMTVNNKGQVGKTELIPEPLEKIRTLSFIEALYFCTITFATIGYGDISPASEEGKLLIACYSFGVIAFVMIGIPWVVGRKRNKD